MRMDGSGYPTIKGDKLLEARILVVADVIEGSPHTALTGLRLGSKQLCEKLKKQGLFYDERVYVC